MGFELLGQKLAQLGQDTKTSVQKMGESYQMGNRIAEEKKNLNKLLVQIGEAAYAKFEENPPEGLEQIFADVKASKQSIAQLEDQKQKLHGAVVCPECGKEAGKGEKFCSSCGAKLPEAQADENTEKVKQDMKDAASEAGDIVNDAADRAKDFFSSMAGKADAFMKGVSSKLNEKAEEAAATSEAEETTGAAEMAEEAANAFEEAVEATKEKVSEAAEATGVTEAAEKAADVFEEAVEATKEKVSEAAEATGVTEAAEKAANVFEEAVEATKEKVADAEESASSASQNLIDEAIRKVQEAANSSQES